MSIQQNTPHSARTIASPSAARVTSNTPSLNAPPVTNVRTSRLWTFVNKLRGDGVALPPRSSLSAIGLAWLGGCIAIAVIAGLANRLSLPLVLGSFGASCVLVFGFPDVPFSQPRNVIAGHLLSSAVGLTFLTFCGPQWWSVALSAGTAIALMMGTRTVHPPAGSNPVIVFLTKPDWHFLVYPTGVGAVLLVLVALAYNNATRTAKYPKYW